MGELLVIAGLVVGGVGLLDDKDTFPVSHIVILIVAAVLLVVGAIVYLVESSYEDVSKDGDDD